MSLPKILIDPGFLYHPKLALLSAKLGVSKETAGWALLKLWSWSIHYRETGDLRGLSNEEIAAAAGWVDAKPQAFVAALVQCRWLDTDYCLHDWLEHQGRLIRQRAYDRARKSETELPPEIPTDVPQEAPQTQGTVRSLIQEGPCLEEGGQGGILPTNGASQYVAMEFSHCRSPGIGAKTRAIDELIRMGVDPKKIAASARSRARRGWGFWDHIRLLEPRNKPDLEAEVKERLENPDAEA